MGPLSLRKWTFVVLVGTASILKIIVVTLLRILCRLGLLAQFILNKLFPPIMAEPTRNPELLESDIELLRQDYHALRHQGLAHISELEHRDAQPAHMRRSSRRASACNCTPTRSERNEPSAASQGNVEQTSPFREVGSHGLRIQVVESPNTTRPMSAPQPEQHDPSSGRQEGQPRPSAVLLGKRPETHRQTIANANASASTVGLPIDRPTIPTLRLVDRSSRLLLPIPSRREYAIRSRPEKVGWYASEGPLLSAVPMPPEEASLADLYTNIYEDQGWHYLQIWLRVDPPNWVKVEENYPHPYLEDHVLRILDKGEPRWVTKKTYRKYVTCWRKQGYRISEGGPSGLPGSP